MESKLDGKRRQEKEIGPEGERQRGNGSCHIRKVYWKNFRILKKEVETENVTLREERKRGMVMGLGWNSNGKREKESKEFLI